MKAWFEWDILFRFLKYVSHSFLDNNGFETAKSLTYMSLFAVVPLMTLILAILSAFPSFQVFGTQIQEMIFNRLLPSSSSELEGYLGEFAQQARNLTWVGAVMLFATAYLMLRDIERGFNRIWNVAQLRKGLSSFLLYWSVLSLSPLLLGIGFAISSYITSLALFEAFTEVSDYVGASSLVLGIFPTVLTTLAFTLLYVAVPNCHVRLRHGFIGGLTVAILFIVVKWTFSRFIQVTSYELLYGTFAAIPIFLIWLYLSWAVILFGANLVRAIPLYRHIQTGPGVHPTLLILALIHRFWEKYQQGESLLIDELVDANWPYQEDEMDTHLAILRKHHIIRACGDSEFILTRDLHGLSLWDFLAILPWPLPRANALQEGLPQVIVDALPAFDKLKAELEEVEQKGRETFSRSLASFLRENRA